MCEDRLLKRIKNEEKEKGLIILIWYSSSSTEEGWGEVVPPSDSSTLIKLKLNPMSELDPSVKTYRRFRGDAFGSLSFLSLPSVLYPFCFAFKYF